MPELDSVDRIFLTQISDGKIYAMTSWSKAQAEKLQKLGMVKIVNSDNLTFQITKAGREAVK